MCLSSPSKNRKSETCTNAHRDPPRRGGEYQHDVQRSHTHRPQRDATHPRDTTRGSEHIQCVTAALSRPALLVPDDGIASCFACGGPQRRPQRKARREAVISSPLGSHWRRLRLSNARCPLRPTLAGPSGRPSCKWSWQCVSSGCQSARRSPSSATAFCPVVVPSATLRRRTSRNRPRVSA